MEKRHNLYNEIRKAIASMPAQEASQTLTSAALMARLKSTPEEREAIDAQAKKLQEIKNVGETLSVEILAAVGRFLHEHER